MGNGAQTAAHRKRYLIIGVLVIAAVLVAIAAVVLFGQSGRTKSEKQATSPIPENIQAQADFPLYYPDSPQQKWQIERSSFQSDDGVVLYVATGPSGSVNVTQQSKPQDFDFEKFHKQVLTGGTLLSMPAGTGAVGKAEDRLIGSLVADNTWILLTPANTSVTQEQIIELSSILKTD